MEEVNIFSQNIFGAGFGLIAGVVGLVLSIGVRKATNNIQVPMP